MMHSDSFLSVSTNGGRNFSWDSVVPTILPITTVLPFHHHLFSSTTIRFLHDYGPVLIPLPDGLPPFYHQWPIWAFLRWPVLTIDPYRALLHLFSFIHSILPPFFDSFDSFLGECSFWCSTIYRFISFILWWFILHSHSTIKKFWNSCSPFLFMGGLIRDWRVFYLFYLEVHFIRRWNTFHSLPPGLFLLSFYHFVPILDPFCSFDGEWSFGMTIPFSDDATFIPGILSISGAVRSCGIHSRTDLVTWFLFIDLAWNLPFCWFTLPVIRCIRPFILIQEVTCFCSFLLPFTVISMFWKKVPGVGYISPRCTTTCSAGWNFTVTCRCYCSTCHRASTTILGWVSTVTTVYWVHFLPTIPASCIPGARFRSWFPVFTVHSFPFWWEITFISGGVLESTFLPFVPTDDFYRLPIPCILVLFDAFRSIIHHHHFSSVRHHHSCGWMHSTDAFLISFSRFLIPPLPPRSYHHSFYHSWNTFLYRYNSVHTFLIPPFISTTHSNYDFYLQVHWCNYTISGRLEYIWFRLFVVEGIPLHTTVEVGCILFWE